ncbi:PadR family transcriptional regulator [Nocardia sp. NPDC059246]|uniref:PadR family transcriptional regulator n=1 Tax=unclassified Nocardia TaxID=2637762 RepID=UPI003699D6B3
MRKTRSLVQVAAVLLAEPNGRHWGYDLIKQSGERSAVVYPMLTKMLNEGWLTDGWEDPAAITEKRPPRRYYELTDEGKYQLGAMLRSAYADKRFSSMNLGWAQ